MGIDKVAQARDNATQLLEKLLREQTVTNRRLAAIYELLDDFTRSFLAARFPYGRPDDRFARRRPRG